MSILTRSPFSIRPGPTAITSPRVGFSFAVSGMYNPPRIASASSSGRITTRSSNGWILIPGLVFMAVAIELSNLSYVIGDRLPRLKVECVSEILYLPVVVKRRRPLAVELEPLEKGDLFIGRVAPERRVVQELMKTGLFDRLIVGFLLDKFESPDVARDDTVVQDDVQGKGRQVDAPGFDQRIKERDAMLGGEVEDVGVEELQHDHPGLFVAPVAQLRHHMEPVVILQLLPCHSFDDVEQGLGDQPLQLAERLLFEDDAKVGR